MAALPTQISVGSHVQNCIAMNTIVDTDRHVCEPISMWKERMPKEYHAYLPELRHDNEMADFARRMLSYGQHGGIPIIPENYSNGVPLYNKFIEPIRLEASHLVAKDPGRTQKAANPLGQLENMDANGIGVALIYPGDANYLINNDNVPAEVSEAFADAYCDWIAEYCAADPERLIPLGVASRHTPEALLRGAKKVIERGWRNILLRPEVIMGYGLAHPDFEPFWALCEAHQVSVCIKGGTHLHGTTAGLDRFDTHFGLHACSHYMEAHMAFLTLLEGGVLERYPKLKVAFMEAGASWLPAWLWRLDHVCYEQMPMEISHHIKMLPSEYFKRQCWIAFEMEEPGLRTLIDTVGVDKLLWGTDFPHFDHEDEEVEGMTHPELSAEEIRIIQRENPRAFFNLAPVASYSDTKA